MSSPFPTVRNCSRSIERHANKKRGSGFLPNVWKLPRNVWKYLSLHGVVIAPATCSSQLIQSWLPGIGNAGFRQYGIPDFYMSDNYLCCLLE
eukprot:scaffold12016_cov65-Attheya_sp.AAC.3